MRSQVSGINRSRFLGEGQLGKLGEEEHEEGEPAIERRRECTDLGLDLGEREVQVVCHGIRTNTHRTNTHRTYTPGQIPTGQLPPLQNTPWTYTHQFFLFCLRVRVRVRVRVKVRVRVRIRVRVRVRVRVFPHISSCGGYMSRGYFAS